MSFRQKINGPMCFVEYEDVSFAAQAIKELYGHNLVSCQLQGTTLADLDDLGRPSERRDPIVILKEQSGATR